MIALKNVTKAYGSKVVLGGVTLRIDPGSCMCIVGDSGSGKTTLLRLLIRADDPTEGAVEVDGVNIQTLPAPILQLYRRRVGVIFQDPILLEHATVEENLCLPLELLGAPATLIRRNAADLLKRLGLASKAALFPKDISLSERSLLCLGRAVITAPMVIVADEPLQHLDAAQAKIATEILANMHKKGATVVLGSRDLALAHALKAHVTHLKEGKITRQAETEKSTPKTADAHRILEEKAQKGMDDSMEGEVEISLDPPEKGRTGKRIRITSIGSNS